MLKFESSLTAQELKVAELVSKGMTNKEISEKLNTKKGTIANQLGTIFNKMHIANRVMLAVEWERQHASAV